MAYVVHASVERYAVFPIRLLVLSEFVLKWFSFILLKTESFCEFSFFFLVLASFGSCLYIGMIEMLVRILEFSFASSL